MQAQLARDRSASRKRHLQIAQELQAVAVHGLLELRAKIAAGTPLGMSPHEVHDMLAESIKLERAVLGTDDDRSQFTEIRVFIGTHKYESEAGYGQPQ